MTHFGQLDHPFDYLVIGTCLMDSEEEGFADLAGVGAGFEVGDEKVMEIEGLNHVG